MQGQFLTLSEITSAAVILLREKFSHPPIVDTVRLTTFDIRTDGSSLGRSPQRLSCPGTRCIASDQAEALTLADRIVVMKDGLIQQIGSPNNVYERPRNMFVASLLQSRDQIISRVRWIKPALPPRSSAAICRSRCRHRWHRTLAGREEQVVVLGLRPEDVLRRSQRSRGIFYRASSILSCRSAPTALSV
jgi:ABC-type Fe3+/spermidine/putrescine transport system ATPase subunit